MPAPIPADHDDDDGRPARRPAARHWSGRRWRAPAAARYRNCRGTDPQSGPDALFNAGHLPLYGPIPAMEPTTEGWQSAARARDQTATRRVDVGICNDRQSTTTAFTQQGSFRCFDLVAGYCLVRV